MHTTRNPAWGPIYVAFESYQFDGKSLHPNTATILFSPAPMVIINWMYLRIWDQKIVYKLVKYHHLRKFSFFLNGWVQILEKNFKPGPCVCCHILWVDGHLRAFSLQLNRMLCACAVTIAIKKSLVQYNHPRLRTWRLGGKWKEKIKQEIFWYRELNSWSSVEIPVTFPANRVDKLWNLGGLGQVDFSKSE